MMVRPPWPSFAVSYQKALPSLPTMAIFILVGVWSLPFNWYSAQAPTTGLNSPWNLCISWSLPHCANAAFAMMNMNTMKNISDFLIVPSLVTYY